MDKQPMTNNREAMTLEQVRDDIDRWLNGSGAAVEAWKLEEWRDAIDARLSRAAEPVAWSITEAIKDEEGIPIGLDEPRVVWGSECPDPDEGWSPLYGEPVHPPEPARDATKQPWTDGEKAHMQAAAELVAKRERVAKVSELAAAARAYFEGYCVDEADDWFDGSDARVGENTGCTREQHNAAKRLRNALAAMAQESGDGE